MNEAAMQDSGSSPNLAMRVFGPDSGASRMFGLGVWIGAWRAGRLGRVGYLVAAILLYGMLGVAQLIILDAMEPAPIQLTPTYQPPSATAQMVGLGASLSISVLTLIAGLNIAAKRIRAIGAPGWGGAAVLTVLNGAALFTIPGIAYPWLPIAVLIGLIVIPDGLLKGETG